MNQINLRDKDRIIKYISENELDYSIVDNQISKFGIVSEDNKMFYIYSHNDSYVIAKYDVEKDKQNLPPYDYFEYKNIPQILEQISFYDNSLPKVYFTPTADSVNVPFDQESYNDEWAVELIENDLYKVESCDSYNYIEYCDVDVSPKLISPFNTIHEVSTINKMELTTVDKLLFQIHPVSLVKGKEKYFTKLLCNNEEVLKEYINFNVFKKKGLKMWIKKVFENI